uniref:RHS repeat protein n=1 Tax=Oscillatoria sp. FACHB-1407 TaxID=2692847 RepID=UPI0016857BDF
SVRNADGTYLNSINGQYSGVNGTGYNPANPEYGSVYILTTKDGTQYEIDARSGDLLKVTDLNGNSLTYTDAGVFSSTGQSITFERDAQGRIVSVQDPMQEYIRYEYNAQGDLISVTDREQNTTRMEYNGERPHYLDRIIDPLDRPGVRNEYDEQGRLQFMVDAKGNPVEMSYDPTNSTQTVYDQLRNPTTYVYDERGNILTEIDAEGQVTTRAYDEDNNVLTETIITAESGPEGWTTTYTYDDQRNQLTQTNALNQTDYYTYNARGQLLTNTNSLGHTTSYTFDARGNVAFMTDATGYTIAYTYDRFGNSLTINEGANDITTFEYDQFGNKTKEIDALGQVTTFTYDVNGNQLTETTTLTTPTGVRTLTITRTYNDEGQVESVLDTENGLTQYGYDANGNQVFVVDAEGRRTQMRYNERNELIETIYADDTPNDDTDNLRSTVEYDAVGNKVAISDWAGNITRYSYDALRRPTGMVLPDDTPNNLLDNLQTGVEYDQAGRMTTLMKDGVRTEFEYDAVGRIVLTRNINAQGQRLETRTVYDAAGRKISETDPLNHTTRFVYDELDRLTETIFADGSRSRTTYDASGDAIATTDQLGRTTSFDYNVLDQLTAVVDAKQQRTTYQYNEAGNLVAQTDANNRTTRYEYDGLGRRTAIVRPMLQRSEMEYNRVGNLIEVTDFNGEATQYEYNSLNQLTAKHFLSDNQSVEFTYTTAGRRDSVTDERGVTQYLYDAAGRLLTRTEPDNTTIAYTYDDVTGQVETITTPSGTTTHHYSALGQLERVIASTGETVYTYNAVGNLAETILPNGVRQTYQYDVLNRVTAVETKDATGTLLSSYGYTYDLVGNRTSVTELNGRRVEFTYDELYRLIKETTTDPTNGNQIIEYAYDNVGNRMRRTDSTEGVTTYVYDANDRLTSTALGGVATTYTYDNNGNLITVQAPGQQTQYGWNQENRLVEADITTGGTTRQVDYQYDADGIRVSSTVNGQETRYLVDANRPYAEVLQEYAPNGQIGVSYVHGHELISQDRAGDTSFYTHDAHSGVRLLSNESGRVTDTYTYDAYGSLLRFNGTTENNYLYRGEQADPNIGMQYLRARYYDQNTGRFASTDPFEGWQEQPMSRHRYMYGNGNPIRYIDPSGMFNSELTVALTISYALSSAITAGAQFIVGRNYDRIHGSIAWDGDAKSFEFGFPEHMGGGVLSGGVFIIEATSEFVDRRQERGRWLIVAPGLSVPTPPPFNEIPDLSFTYGSVAISSPRILGPHVRILSGGFLALSAGIVTGAGFSHESYIMGYGTVRSDQILGHWNMSVGYDMGIDIFSGISYPIAWESLVGNDN